ncbi:Mevalonyl-coenzyme A hydratase sidH [Penicillium macrosclerotiorum]|uniref:Mevalonyl-coenzyme A hydratase sidH n=1 Tax=Penicillium macrosclerotiorum TaxID=303699 RepID=UPI0025485282|nr:Mevalonyl-coenzyme A hydratase sidH [Penicillium macrosclerotiorum]KAJ5666932.1 Mevalonyl-coenzyme A hydratase sidH [Penicillium macrosclerotiorum]
MPNFTIPPPQPQHALLSFPAPHILLVTLNRPRDLNCINSQGHSDLHDVWEWLDEEPSLRVGIITGKGRAFCAGADLKGKCQEWNSSAQSSGRRAPTPSTGFGGLARRKGRKPVLAAINGLCFGGGTEMIINADLVVASSRATLGLPEVKRGVVAMAGALPRLVRTVGKQRAMEMVLTGRAYSAAQVAEWGLVNEVVDVGGLDKGNVEGVNEAVVRRAVQVAGEIAANSPDAVLVSREGVKLGWEGIGADEATVMLNETWVRRLYEGENIKEGLRAFVEKRAPAWKDSKL